AGEQFFNAVLAWVAKQPRPQRTGRADTRPAAAQASNTVRVQEPNVVADVLSEELKKLATQVDAVAKDLDDEQKIEFTALSNRCRALQVSLAAWLGQDLPGQVYWVETTTSSTRAQRVDLASAPIEVGPALREHLYDKVPTVVMTSATLSAGGRLGFRHFQDRLGLEEAGTLQLGSPFDYRRQVELHLFRKMPDPSADPAGYEEAVLAKVPEYIKRTQGRAFVLFTSYQAMQKATTRLRTWCAQQDYPLLSQGDGL